MLRRPNATPLQTKHTRRQPTSMWRRGPEQTSRTQQPRHFLQQHARLRQVLDDLSRRDHVEVFGGKLRVLKLTLKSFKAQGAHMLHGAHRYIKAVSDPTVLARREQKTACP